MLAKENNVKGYSKLRKEDLISAILGNVIPGEDVPMASPRGPSEPLLEANAQALLTRRTKSTVAYSRAESEKRLEKEAPVEATAVPAMAAARSKEVAGQKSAQKRARAAKKPAVKGELVSSAELETLAQARGSAKVRSDARAAPQKPAKPVAKRSRSKAAKVAKVAKVAKSEATPPSPAPTGPARANPAPSKAQNQARLPALPVKKHAPQPEEQKTPEPRFQELPHGDQLRLLERVSKPVRKILELRAAELQKRNKDQLQDYLELLETEKGRFTVYNPSEKMLRNFIDESIALINKERELKLNQEEHRYVEQELPLAIKKKEKKVKEILARVDGRFSEIDAARQIVDVLGMKTPFHDNYLVTVISQKIKAKQLLP